MDKSQQIDIECPLCHQEFGLDVQTFEDTEQVWCPYCDGKAHRDHYTWSITLVGKGRERVEDKLRSLLYSGTQFVETPKY